MRLSILLPEIGYTDFHITNEKVFEALSVCDDRLKLTSESLVFLEKKKFIGSIPQSATMILAAKELDGSIPNGNYGVCYIDQPRFVFVTLHNYLSNDAKYTREVSKTIIGSDCVINPLSSITAEGVQIGNNVIIEEFAVIRENVVIGDRCIIRSGSIIGGQGFEIKRNGDELIRVEHVGGVIIGNDVEIQHNCCISKAIYPWDNTEIGEHVKVGNLVQIGHGSKIEASVMIAVSSTIAGNSSIGEGTWIGPGVTISNRLNIGKNSKLNIGAVVIKDVPEGGSVTGNFAVPHNEFMYNMLKMERKTGNKRI